MKTSEEIRKSFLDFMKSKGHKEAQNASLVPLNDPTVLFTTAGMHPLVPYLLGQPHSLGTRLTNTQRSVRTNDIEEVGDTTHLTFFEMLGYWSLGDYFKKEALNFSFEFFTSPEYMSFDPNRIYVTVFEGDNDAPIDQESIETWKNIFKTKDIEAELWNRSDFNDPNLRIFPLNKKENWWGPAGQTGPCGPDSEMFYWRGEGKPDFNKFVPWDDSGMFIEIGNDVFMEFNKNINGEFEPLEKKNVDFGGGFERLTMLHQNMDEKGNLSMKYSVYDTDLFKPILERIEELTENKYDPKENLDDETKSFRIIAEHSRSSTFILADGVIPSSKDQGYILRRLIRRIVRSGLKLGIEQDFTKDLAIVVIEKMKGVYPHLKENEAFIIDEIEKEEIKFRRTLDKGLKELEKISGMENFEMNGKLAFDIYQTYGFPLEMILDELEIDENRAEIITNEFKFEEDTHRLLSRAGAEQKFKGGLADSSVETTKLHTAHHLLLASLQKLIDPNIKQKGSNITSERLRMDFNFDRKLTEEEIKRVEDLVNEKIEEGLYVKRFEMPKEKAEELGAQMEFGTKYPEIVSIYFIGGGTEQSPEEQSGLEESAPIGWFSAEFCGGPHVSNTKELGEGGKRFKIIGQENVGAGVKRIKAALV